MTFEAEKRTVRQAMDSALSGLTGDEELAARVLAQAKTPPVRGVKRRMLALAVLAGALLAALSIAGASRSVMDRWLLADELVKIDQVNRVIAETDQATCTITEATWYGDDLLLCLSITPKAEDVVLLPIECVLSARNRPDGCLSLVLGKELRMLSFPEEDKDLTLGEYLEKTGKRACIVAFSLRAGGHDMTEAELGILGGSLLERLPDDSLSILWDAWMVGHGDEAAMHIRFDTLTAEQFAEKYDDTISYSEMLRDFACEAFTFAVPAHNEPPTYLRDVAEGTHKATGCAITVSDVVLYELPTVIGNSNVQLHIAIQGDMDQSEIGVDVRHPGNRDGVLNGPFATTWCSGWERVGDRWEADVYGVISYVPRDRSGERDPRINIPLCVTIRGEPDIMWVLAKENTAK